MKTVRTEIPENLYKGAMALAKEGWFRDEKEVFSEAIRRFLESHQPELIVLFQFPYPVTSVCCHGPTKIPTNQTIPWPRTNTSTDGRGR
jgi:hypothetical protein